MNFALSKFERLLQRRQALQAEYEKAVQQYHQVLDALGEIEGQLRDAAFDLGPEFYRAFLEAGWREWDENVRQQREKLGSHSSSLSFFVRRNSAYD